jgi:hypothetical protein
MSPVLNREQMDRYILQEDELHRVVKDVKRTFAVYDAIAEARRVLEVIPPMMGGITSSILVRIKIPLVILLRLIRESFCT